MTDKTSLLDAARFFRLYGDADRAGRYLKVLGRLAAGDPQVQAEAALLSARIALDRFGAARGLVRRGRRGEAARLLADLEIAPGVWKLHPVQARELARLQRELAAEQEALAAIAPLLKSKGVAIPDLSGAQALRLMQALRPGQSGAPDVPPKHYGHLAQAWAEPFARTPPTPAAIEEAAALADRLAAFFASGRLDQAPSLAGEILRSKLPHELKLSLFTRARAYEKPAKPIRWERLEYIHPKARREFHYYVQLPPGYRPDEPRPVLLALHGQNSTAEVMQHFWGRLAADNGIILISPEYVYGRKSGYLLSAEEQYAVMGALWHAAGMFHVDMDRVYLTGHSQGGHACWDIGSAQAGRFAAVVPIIGAERAGHTYPNFRNSAVYAVDGSEDGLAPKLNREMIGRLGSAWCDATYVEYVARGHEAFHEEYAAIIDWLLGHRRKAAAEEVHLVATRNCELEAKWIRLLRTQPPLPDRRAVAAKPYAFVKARARNNHVHIEAENVTRVQVLLAAGLFDFDRPVTIHANGRKVYGRRMWADWLCALQEAYASRDRQAVYLGRISISVPARAPPR